MKKQLRKVVYEDLELLYLWRNHAHTRENSFDKSVISLSSHKSWFDKMINSNLITTYILEVDHIPAGTIRFDVENEGVAKINYLVDPLQQGKGLGTALLKLGVHKFFAENAEIKKVYGLVFRQNKASVRIFEKLSFKNVSDNTSELKFEKLKNENRK
ncbi:GNAT family N-acetyltransferase [Zunongwangia sp. H14]|uniref:GNAT family N-acetyltransferase n=1 Tax=Zunongwangia sp. H14 TaxID=3240792 RepID=UPI00356571D6